MSLTRTIFKNPFQANKTPDWSCPTCHKGVLQADPKKIKTIESVDSISLHNHEEWEPGWMCGIFVGVLKCSNTFCGETIIMTGTYQSDEEQEYDRIHKSCDMVVNDYLTPTCFNPPLHIFQINKDVPLNIQKEIINSFNIFWLDISSCANKVRVVVELIMDDMKIAKTYLKGKKRKRYILDERIKLFKNKNSEQADLLMAIKWIGNSGSHINTDLTKDDILGGFEILEHITAKLYEKDTKRITKLTKQINKRKKPIGKIKEKNNS